MEILYQKSQTIKSLKEYFQPYLNLLTKPSGSKLFLILLAMLSMQFVTSVRYIHKWFLSKFNSQSLNSYYYLLSYADIPLDAFLRITVKTAFSLISKQVYGLPVFLIIDDTLMAKFGTHFDCYQKMFDHAKHNGSNYLNGHCFVALSVSLPIIIEDSVRYLSIPVGFRLREQGKNKLEIAAKMIDEAMLLLADYPMTILLCDSWYPKGAVRKTVEKHRNLELIASVRVDTNLFGLKPQKTGKRGRPPKTGKPIDIHTDLNFIRVEDYFIAVKQVLTNLFEAPVYLTVTAIALENRSSYKVFISTLMPEEIKNQLKGFEKNLSESLVSQVLWLLPLHLYSYRWAIEACFYEMKTFWSFGLYMLRGKKGIENFVNFLGTAYAAMKILPHSHEQFSFLKNESPQTAKYFIGDLVKQELFLWRFVSNPETRLIYSGFLSSQDFSDLFTLQQAVS